MATILAVGCGGSPASTPGSESTCRAAFAAAAAVDDMADTVADLYPAVRACASVAEWRAAFDAEAGAGFTGPAEDVLSNICSSGVAEVADAPLCQVQ